MSENSRDDKPSVFLNGWMTDQYENGAKPPVPRTTFDTTTKAVNRISAALTSKESPTAWERKFLADLLDALVAERDEAERARTQGGKAGRTMMEALLSAQSDLAAAIKERDEAQAYIEGIFDAANQYEGRGRFSVPAEWRDDMTPSQVYETGMIDVVCFIKEDIRSRATLSTPKRDIEVAGAWIVAFDDIDNRQELFSGDGAEQAARAYFKKMTGSWNCHLFRRVDGPKDALAALPLPPTPTEMI